MNKWGMAVLTLVIGFVVGWFAQKAIADGHIGRCHQALQLLSKGASMQDQHEAAKILSGP